MKSSDYFKKYENDLEYLEEKNRLTTMLDLGNDILDLRLLEDISQSELARRAGTKQSNISRVESGLGNPTVRLLEKIGKALNARVIIRFERISHQSQEEQYVDLVNSWVEIDQKKNNSPISYNILNNTGQSYIAVNNWPQRKNASVECLPSI